MALQLDFKAKGVLVTHGATGLGRRIAAAFHELGATVALHDSSATNVDAALRELGGGSRLKAAPGDLSDTADISRIVDKAIVDLGRLDVVVCLGTKASLRVIERIDEDYFGQVLGENAKQAFFLTQACVPALRATRGSVVHVTSTVGLVGGPKGAVGYATASAAMMQMTRMMALELSSDGIRVNAVCPASAEARDPAAAATYAEYFSKRSPLGRVAMPDEIASAVLYLATPMSGYTTGAALMVDGGITSGHYVS
jgi:NAD(P)-dependent dehydrogenase (short-subunit alcohol dehydrogenase family)